MWPAHWLKLKASYILATPVFLIPQLNVKIINGDRSAFSFDLNTAGLWCLEDDNPPQGPWKWQQCCVVGACL